MHKVLGCGIVHFFATLVRKEVPENTGDSNWGFYWLEHMYPLLEGSPASDLAYLTFNHKLRFSGTRVAQLVIIGLSYRLLLSSRKTVIHTSNSYFLLGMYLLDKYSGSNRHGLHISMCIAIKKYFVDAAELRPCTIFAYRVGIFLLLFGNLPVEA